MQEPQRPVEEPGPTVPDADEENGEREREHTPPPPTPEEARGEEPPEGPDSESDDPDR